MKVHDYSQPQFYHFSKDSVEFAHYAANLLKEKGDIDVLDIGCGCGVVGIEFTKQSQGVKQILLLEKQEEYRSFLTENIKQLSSDTKVFCLFKNWQSIKLSQKFDCVLSNPPFYIIGNGREPNEKLKKECHFFTQSDFDSLLKVMAFARKDDGVALFLGRKDQKHIQHKLITKEIPEVKSLGKTSIFKIA